MVREKRKGIDAYIIEDTSSPAGHRLTTFVLKYPRFIHAELLTHRMFSRNSSSSRAIPVKRLIKKVIDDPAMPEFWGMNQRGMSARVEADSKTISQAKYNWLLARDDAVKHAEHLMNQGLHKQIVNRVIEPWMHIEVVVSSTEYENFYKQRCHPDAQPEIKVLADMMREEHKKCGPGLAHAGWWHMPFISPYLRGEYNIDVEKLKKISVARCARTSYATHEGIIDEAKDVALYEMLVSHDPLHASPLEHVAVCTGDNHRYGNFTGFKQLRQFIEEEKREQRGA